MNWLLISILAYFLIAWEIILDKFLISSKKVSHPSVYAFYSGILSLSTLIIFFPFGFHWISVDKIIISILGGMLFLAGILSLFYALAKNEASRVTPVVGAVVPLFSFFLAFIFLKEILNQREIIGGIFLVSGGLAISLESLRRGKRKFFSGFGNSILAGVLLAGAYVIYKKLYQDDQFINVFIWTRLGLVFGAVCLFLVPSFRKNILASIYSFKKSKKESSKTGGIFVANKILGGVGSMLFNYAVSLGSVTIVNALVSLEYVFIFIIALVSSHWLPKVFQENKKTGIIIQKMVSIIVIAVGVALVAK